MPSALDASGISLTNLVAYYKMETGAITTDSSGNSKTLTNNGTVTATTGLFGDCIDLGTANSTKSLSRADGLAVDLSGAYSINLWAKLRALPATNTVFLLADWRSTTGTARYVSLFFQQFGGDGAGNYRIQSNHSEGYATDVVNVANTIGIIDWHMYTVTATGTVVSLYVDGQKIATGTRGSTTTAVNKTVIGADVTPANYASAYIDDTSFWSRALTDAEIATLYDLVPSSIILV